MMERRAGNKAGTRRSDTAHAVNMGWWKQRRRGPRKDIVADGSRLAVVGKVRSWDLERIDVESFDGIDAVAAVTGSEAAAAFSFVLTCYSLS